MGADVRLDRSGLTVTGSGELDGIDVDLHDAGELTPIVAALAALASTPRRGSAASRTSGATRPTASPPSPPSSTGSAVPSPRPRTGCASRRRPLHGGRVRTYHDHRMATAGAVLGLRVPGVVVEDVETTAKTLPDFVGLWRTMLAGGAAVVLPR